MEMIHAVESKPVVVKGVIQQVNSASEHLTGCSLGPGFMEMIHAVESKPVVVKGVIQQVNECKRLVSTVIPACQSSAQIFLIDLQLGDVHKSPLPFLNVLLAEPCAFPFTILVKHFHENINCDRGRQSYFSGELFRVPNRVKSDPPTLHADMLAVIRRVHHLRPGAVEKHV